MARLSQLPTDALEAVLRLCDAPTLSRLARTSRRLRACVQGSEALWCSHFGAHLAPHGHRGGGLGGGGTWPGTTATATLAPRSWAAAYSGWLRFRPSALQTLPPPEQQRTTELQDRRQVFALALTAAPSSATAAAGGARLWAVDGRGRLRELALSTERPHTELRSACVTDGCAALTIAAAPPCSAAAAAAHELLVGSSDGSVRCWDARSDMSAAVWSCTAAHRDEVFCVQRDDGEFKGGSARFASTSADGRVCLWDARSPTEPLCQMEGPSGSIFSCAFARGSRPGEDYLFCAGEDKMVHKFSCADGEWLAVLAGHRRDIYSVCVAPAGESKGAAGVVLSAGRDGLLKLWDVEGGAEEQDAIGQINCGTGIEGLVACGDRCCLTAKRCGVVELWDYQKGLFTPPPRLAAGLHNPVVRRGAKGAAARVVQPEIYSRDTKLSCVDACAGWICTGSMDGSIDVWASC